jgi:hypothetical protein
MELGMNVEKPKITRISKQPSPVQFMIDIKQRENVEYFKSVGSLIRNDAKCLRGIKSRIDMAKAAANKRRFSPTNSTYIEGRNY